VYIATILAVLRGYSSCGGVGEASMDGYCGGGDGVVALAELCAEVTGAWRCGVWRCGWSSDPPLGRSDVGTNRAVTQASSVRSGSIVLARTITFLFFL
jgi:hypothetical protein